MKNKPLTALFTLGTLACSIGLQAITESEQNDILFMKQEEKLARDVYQKLGETHDLKIFSNIAKAEQRHMDSIDYLITTNSLEDLTPMEQGVYSYDELNILYGDLVAKGQKSLIDALEVGVTIEEVDIADLEEALLHTEDVTIKNIYSNLLRGSQNHLRAFTGQLEFGADGIQEPKLRIGKNGNGGNRLEASNTHNGNDQQIQSKSANGRGTWKGERGNEQSTNAGKGNAGVQNQNVTIDPSIPTLYRTRNSNGKQARYSQTISTELANTPWPNGEFLEKGWYATWMGNVHVGQYPKVYIERFGWITIEGFEAGEVHFSDVDGNRFLTTEERYPWIFDKTNGKWI